MLARSWFDALKSRFTRTLNRQERRASGRPGPATRRLRMEALEDRCLLASLTVSDYTLIEGNAGTTNAVVTVRLSSPVNTSVSVKYNTANGTALAGSDYQAVSGTLNFNKGQTSKTILVPVIGDGLSEPNETFSVNLFGAKRATIADGQGVVTIVNDDPRISISDVTLKEGNSGTTNFDFTVSLSAASGQPVTVNYATADDTAAGGSDYVAKTGTLTIPAGQTSGTISVLVNGDRLGEWDETFFVNLSGPTNGFIADGQGVGTIVDDEPRMSIADWAAAEGNSGTTEFTFTVTLSDASGAPVASDEPVTVNYATADLTPDEQYWYGPGATADVDYTAKTGTLTIPVGATSGTITVLVNGDRLAESEENFFVNLSTPTGALLDYSQARGTILDDESYISIGGMSAAEGNDGTKEFTFTVTLSDAYGAPLASDAPVSVDFATADGTATILDNDYVTASGTLTIPAGLTSGTITVLVNGDLLVEYDESFVVNLSNPTNAPLSNSQAWGTIQSDDNAVLHIDSWSDWEPDPYYGGSTFFAFTVWLSAPSTETVTVNFSTSDGTAWAGSDYYATSGTLTFTPGQTSQTIYVEVFADWDYEDYETFYVNLSGASGNNALIQPGGGTGTIYDNYY